MANEVMTYELDIAMMEEARTNEVEITDLTDLELERELERREKECAVAWEAYEVACEAYRKAKDEVSRREDEAELAWLKTFAKRALEYPDELVTSQREYLKRLLEREGHRFVRNCSGDLISATLSDELRRGEAPLDKIWRRLRGHWAPHEYGPLENELEKRRAWLRDSQEFSPAKLRRMTQRWPTVVRRFDTVEDFSMGLVDCEPQVERRRA